MSAECKHCGRDLDGDFNCAACIWEQEYQKVAFALRMEIKERLYRTLGTRVIKREVVEREFKRLTEKPERPNE